jgi:formate-dependent nitrite reductase membrane component NrfD
MMFISFFVVLIGSVLFTGNIDMRFTTAKNMLPYYLLSLSGIIMVFCISKKLEKISINSTLFYIGNHTMPILALNLLALKIGSLIKIWIYGLPINNLSSYTVIYEHNSYFWVIYTIIGISIPLLVNFLYNRLFLWK